VCVCVCVLERHVWRNEIAFWMESDGSKHGRDGCHGTHLLRNHTTLRISLFHQTNSPV